MPNTLLVMPNPYAALDARGRPAAAYPLEGLAGRDRYLGAQVDHARTKKIGRLVLIPDGYTPAEGAGEADLMAAWASTSAVEVPDTAYYRLALRRGDVLPGNADTAKAVGLPDGTATGTAALSAAHAAACAAHRAAYGSAAACEPAPPGAAAALKKTTPKTPAGSAPEEKAP